MEDLLSDSGGLSTPAAVDRARDDALRRLRRLLVASGVGEAEIDAAIAEDAVDLLVIDRMMLASRQLFTEEELLRMTGIEPQFAQRLWRALGFPEVAAAERAFTDFDVEALTTIQSLMHLGIADTERAVQLARVMGSSMARVAEAQVTMSQVADVVDDDVVQRAETLAIACEVLLPSLARVLEYVWRRHLQAASRRAWLHRNDASAGSIDLAVGFADMVGFTWLAQQVGPDELARIVARFESLAHDTVVGGGGRVVKMIGDEAMFVVEDMAAAVSIALELADAYADDDLLSDVRVGLAHGPVLSWEGDYFGAVVNRASRIVNIANPGTVLASAEFHRALESDPRFRFHALRPRVLKDIGRVELWSLSRADTVVEADESGRRTGARWRRISEVLRDLDELREHGHRLLAAGTAAASNAVTAAGSAVSAVGSTVAAAGDAVTSAGEALVDERVDGDQGDQQAELPVTAPVEQNGRDAEGS